MKARNSVNGVAAVCLVLLMGNLIVFSCTNHLLVSASSADATTIDVMDLLIDIEGYSITTTRTGPDIRTYNYSSYSSYLKDFWEIEYYDYLLGDPPKEIVTTSYYYESETGDWCSIKLEIHVYESEEDAENEYELQRNELKYNSVMKQWYAFNGPIFLRFPGNDRIFQHGPFLIYFYCTKVEGWVADVMDAFIVKFLENFFKLFTETQPQLPSVNFTGKVVWGIQPGDIITWSCNTTGFAGNEPYSERETVTWEIIEITDDNLAVLIKEKESCPYLYGNSANKHYGCGVVYDIYIWKTVDEGGLFSGVSGYGVEPAIYPVYMEGYTLKSIVESEIYLPETSVVESETYITGHGKTESGMGFTPLETSWIDIILHKATGIITSGSYYYNNNEHSITTSSTVSVETNFALESRLPYVPEIEEEEPTEAEPTETEPTGPEPAEPEPTETGPTGPGPTESEPTEPAEAPLITTEIVIIAAVAVVAVIGIASYWMLRKRK